MSTPDLGAIRQKLDGGRIPFADVAALCDRVERLEKALQRIVEQSVGSKPCSCASAEPPEYWCPETIARVALAADPPTEEETP